MNTQNQADVIVVGAGSSGVQIAADLARQGVQIAGGLTDRFISRNQSGQTARCKLLGLGLGFVGNGLRRLPQCVAV